jgi:hypothetical protein
MSAFWILRQPDDGGSLRKEAKLVHNPKIRYEQILCPINPAGHRRAGGRISPLRVVLPDTEPADFVWTYWECLVQETVLNVFHDAGFTGYEPSPVDVKFARSSRSVPKFWELRVRGSAGVASPESGYRILSVCPGCGLTDDTKIEDPTKVVDESKWDGSDFFHIVPLGSRIFVTDRVVQALSKTSLSGWKAYSLSEMEEVFDIAVPGHNDVAVDRTL